MRTLYHIETPLTVRSNSAVNPLVSVPAAQAAVRETVAISRPAPISDPEICLAPANLSTIGYALHLAAGPFRRNGPGAILGAAFLVVMLFALAILFALMDPSSPIAAA